MLARTVDQLRAVVHDPLDGALLLEMSDGYPGKTAVDLQPLNQDRLRNELEGRDFFQDTVVNGLVEDNGVDCLVLDLSLGPLLLLCGFTAARGGGLGCGFWGLRDESSQLLCGERADAIQSEEGQSIKISCSGSTTGSPGVAFRTPRWLGGQEDRENSPCRWGEEVVGKGRPNGLR